MSGMKIVVINVLPKLLTVAFTFIEMNIFVEC